MTAPELETLANGVRFASYLIEDSVETAIAVVFRGGPRYETLAQAGISAVVSRLAFESEELERAKQRDLVPGTLERLLYDGELELHFTTSPRHVAQAIELGAELLRHRREEAAAIDRAKKEEEEIELENLREAMRFIYENGRARLPCTGTKESRTKLSHEEIRAYAARCFAPAGIALGLAGCFDGAHLELARRKFGALPEAEPLVACTEPNVRLPRVETYQRPFDRPAADMFVTLVFQAPKTMIVRERVALEALAGLGSSMNARLFTRVRYDHLPTYRTSSAALTDLGRRYLVLDAMPDIERQQEMFELLLREVSVMRNLGVSEDIARGVIEAVKSGRREQNYDAEGLAAAIANSLVREDWLRFWEADCREAVESVTTKDVAALAQRIFCYDRLAARVPFCESSFEATALLKKYLGARR